MPALWVAGVTAVVLRSGEARVSDDESTDVSWFPVDALPPLADRSVRRIAHALEERPDSVLDREPEA